MSFYGGLALPTAIALFFAPNRCIMARMAHLSKDDVLKLARLARLKLDDGEVSRFQAEINEILGYVEMLQSVDTTGQAPTYQVTGLVNAMRPDEIVSYGPSQDDLLSNAPQRDGAYIKTRRIL